MVPSRLKASGGRGPSLLVVAALLAALSQAIAGAPTPKPPKLPGNGRLFSSSNRWAIASSRHALMVPNPQARADMGCETAMRGCC